MISDLTFCELREKEVVNITDGKKLGRILDLALTCSGNVLGVIVPGEKKFFKSVSGEESIFVPWKNIVKIAEDAILVELGDRPGTDPGCPVPRNC